MHIRQKRRRSILSNILPFLWQISPQHFKRAKGKKRGRNRGKTARINQLAELDGQISYTVENGVRERNLSPYVVG